MDAIQSRPVLIAVDTNVLLDLADEVDDVTDAVQVIRRRLRQAQLLIPPTVREELANDVLNSEDFEKRERAMSAFRLARAWNIQPLDLIEARRAQARRIGQRLRRLALLPTAEINDSLVLAESALLACSMLLTSDAHLRGLDFERLSYELQTFGLAAPVTATPREIVRKFFR